MITEKDLNEAIAECQGVRHPDANTCIMLAAFYIIKDKLFPAQVTAQAVEEKQYSYAPPPNAIENTIEYESDTEFGRAIYGKDVGFIMSLMDEAMDAIQVLQPPLYKAILRKIED